MNAYHLCHGYYRSYEAIKPKISQSGELIVINSAKWILVSGELWHLTSAQTTQ